MFKNSKGLNWNHLLKAEPMLNRCPHSYHRSRVLAKTNTISNRLRARNKPMEVSSSIQKLFYIPLPLYSTWLHPTQTSHSTRILWPPSCTTITLTLDGEWGSAEVRIEDIKGQGRAQRTKLAPLSKTCKFMAAKQCFRSLLLENVASLVLDWTDRNRKQFRAKRWDWHWVSQGER